MLAGHLHHNLGASIHNCYKAAKGIPLVPKFTRRVEPKGANLTSFDARNPILSENISLNVIRLSVNPACKAGDLISPNMASG
jgi:hypothetical protein